MTDSPLVFDRARAGGGDLVFGAESQELPEESGVALVFEQPAATNGHLVFGVDGDTEPGVLTPVTLVATLPVLRLVANVAPIVRASLVAVLPPIGMSGQAHYDPRVQRPTVVSQRHRFEHAGPVPSGMRAWFQGSPAHPTGWQTAWQPGRRHRAGVQSRIPDAFLSMPTSVCLLHENAIRQGTALLGARFSGLDRTHQDRSSAFDPAIKVAIGRSLNDLSQLHRRRSSFRPHWQAGAVIVGHWFAPAGTGLDLRIGRQAVWQDVMRPKAGRGQPPVVPPEPRPSCYVPCPLLVFAYLQTRAAHLLFQCDHRPAPGPEFTVPILRVYFVSNTVEVVRLPDRTPVPVRALQLDIDADAWAWGFSANLPYSALDLIEPTSDGPVALEITVNGIIWVMLVEGFEVRRAFGQSSLAIRGRSQAAWLAEPTAPTRSFVSPELRTARQLAEAELVRDSLATGFTLDWHLPDWLVPAGCFTYERLSPISAIGQIVGAVGGYLNADPAELRLIARSRYPELPWAWSGVSPDRTLPLDVVKTLNLRWQEKPPFNAVFVSGTHEGVVGHVVRTGTAGDRVAPMVVDSLITHADAARERGRAILADTGRQAIVTLELPMLDAIGRLDPGLLIAVGEGGDTWRGLVRATRISAAWNESLTVRQQVEVERHYG